MTETKRPSKPARSAASGQHPAVKAYRAKLDSIDRSTTAVATELDRMLEEFLAELKTPVPPKP